MANKNNVDITKLTNSKILDESGQPVILGSLFLKNTAVFIFLRHFACIGCRAHAEQVWSQRETYEKNGAKIVFIGNGQPGFITKFKEDLKIQDAPVYTDPTLTAFQHAGFQKTFMALGPASMVNATKLMIQRKELTSYKPDAGSLWQLGGIIVIKPDCQIAYHYISTALGDFPPEKDVQTV